MNEIVKLRGIKIERGLENPGVEPCWVEENKNRE